MLGARSQIECLLGIIGFLLACLALGLFPPGVRALDAATNECTPLRTAEDYEQLEARAEDSFRLALEDRAAGDSASAERKLWAARRLFACCHAYRATAITWSGLGLSDYELGRYAYAGSELREALSAGEGWLPEEAQRQVLEQALAWSERHVAKYTLRLQPPGAKVEVDGGTAFQPDDLSLHLAQGRHVVVVWADGYLPETRAVDAAGGQVGVLSFSLRPAPGAEQPRGGVPARPPPALRKNPQRRALITAAAGVAAAVVGGGLYRGAENRRQEMLAECQAQDGCRRADKPMYLRWLWSSRAALGASAALAGVATAFAWIEARDKGTSAERTQHARRIRFRLRDLAWTF